MNKMSSRFKVWIGGLIIGVMLGLIAGGFTVAIVMSSAFINYALNEKTLIK